MNAADFEYVCNFVRAQAAIVLEPGKEYLVESRLLTLARKEEIASIDDLVQRLRSQPNNGLHRKVVEAMTTNETSFFRDLHPFEALRKSILPELIALHAHARQLHFWCGASSTGQEPYSVLMLIAEHFPDLLNWDFKFLATDLCSEVLARAKACRFSQLEVNRGLPAALLVKYFAQQNTEWEFREDLRRRVDFHELNLVKDWPWLPPLDVVFLRNVLIYLDLESKKAILARIRRLLRPGGYLFLGGAETTFNVDEAFERAAFAGTSCYRVSKYEKVALMIDLDRLIVAANELAPLPATVLRLSALIGNHDCDLESVVEMIAFDQALTARLLRLANSAYSGRATPVRNTHEAVLQVGTAQVLELAVAWGARAILQTRVPAYDLEEGALWRHSVAAAVAAETAPVFCHIEVPPETFTAALLHDVGKLVMGRFLSPEILDFIRRARAVDRLDALEAESLLLSVHHGELGGLIAQHWKLPPRVVQGIIYHHTPEQGRDPICELTYLANQVAKRIEAGLNGRQIELAIPAVVLERVGLTPKNLENFCPVAASRYAQVSRRYNAV